MTITARSTRRVYICGSRRHRQFGCTRRASQAAVESCATNKSRAVCRSRRSVRWSTRIGVVGIDGTGIGIDGVGGLVRGWWCARAEARDHVELRRSRRAVDDHLELERRARLAMYDRFREIELAGCRAGAANAGDLRARAALRDRLIGAGHL